MKLKVNGEVREITTSSSDSPKLANIIEQLGFNPKLVVIEFNGLISPPSKWKDQTVKEGDTLEIVTIVGGGS